jgi:hypothetical protein
MKPNRFVLLALLTGCPAAPALAQEDNTNWVVGATEEAQGTVFKILEAGNNYFAARYECSDPGGASTSISVAIADGGSAGDIWRATVFKGSKSDLFNTTSNVSQFVAGGAALAPGVYSPNATITTKVKKVNVVVSLGNGAPGGFPARATLRVTSDGGGLTCVRKQEENGIAEP